MKNTLLIFTLSVLVGSCTVLENYRFGDMTRTVEKIVALKAQYCAGDNDEAREMLLRSIRRIDPGYTGVCRAIAP